MSAYFDGGVGPNLKVDSLDKMAVSVYTALAEEVKALAKVLDTDSCSVIAQVHQDNKRQAAVIRAKHMVESNKKRREDAGISPDKPKAEPVEVLQEALGDEAEATKQQEDDEPALNAVGDGIKEGETFFGVPVKKSVTPTIASSGLTDL